MIRLQVNEGLSKEYGWAVTKTSDYSELYLSWIPSLSNLKELTLSKFSINPGVRALFKNPMAKVTNLKFDNTVSMFDEPFLRKMHLAFPALTHFDYVQDRSDRGDLSGTGWCVRDLLSNLKSLAKVKHLSISETDVLLISNPVEFDEDKILALLGAALKIIDSKFPKNSTEIDLREQNFGYRIRKEKDKRPVLAEREIFYKQIVPKLPEIQDIDGVYR